MLRQDGSEREPRPFRLIRLPLGAGEASGPQQGVGVGETGVVGALHPGAG